MPARGAGEALDAVGLSGLEDAPPRRPFGRPAAARGRRAGSRRGAGRHPRRRADGLARLRDGARGSSTSSTPSIASAASRSSSPATTRGSSTGRRRRLRLRDGRIESGRAGDGSDGMSLRWWRLAGAEPPPAPPADAPDRLDRRRRLRGRDDDGRASWSRRSTRSGRRRSTASAGTSGSSTPRAEGKTDEEAQGFLLDDWEGLARARPGGPSRRPGDAEALVLRPRCEGGEERRLPRHGDRPGAREARASSRRRSSSTARSSRTRTATR